MSAPSHTIGLARLNPPAARAAGLLAIFTALALAGITLSPLERGFAGERRQGEGDVALYRAEVQRIARGEGYYDAAATELRARGYPTRSVFNWRAPVPVALIGWLPAAELGKGLLGGLGLALLLAAFELLAHEAGLKTALLGAGLLTGPLMFCVLGDIYCMPEIWSGVLVALSICAYGLGRWRWGLAAGLAALLVRELALPYCVLCVGLAVRERRWREVVGWMAGLAAFTAYYAWHLSNVLPRIGADDLAHQAGWLQLGGAAQVIAVSQVNAYLLLLPQWSTALYLAAALVGFAHWNTPAGTRAGLTAALYVVAFAVVGHEFNQYWGAMIGPLLCLGSAQAPRAVRDLWIAARLRSAPAPQ